MKEKIRRPVSCGRRSFYPADADQLTSMLSEMYSRVSDSVGSVPRGIVAPHAGYVFSGPTAARAYSLLEGRSFDRVIIIGPSHYAVFPGASIYDGDAYETPLGQVGLDREFISALEQKSPVFNYVEESEEQEHSVEVQLPFLQKVLAQFKLVPILVYDHSYENCRSIAEALKSAVEESGGSSLLVASSDLFHGPGAAEALEKSRAAAEGIVACNPQKFCEEIASGRYMACGAGPIAIMLMALNGDASVKGELLDLTTSYEVSPASEAYVVGYMASAFY